MRIKKCFSQTLTHCASLVLEIFIPSTEQAVTNDEPDKKAASDQGSSKSGSPLPQQQPRQTENGTARRRKRKRQLKSKTYMNDEGFMGKSWNTAVSPPFAVCITEKKSDPFQGGVLFRKVSYVEDPP